MIYLRILFLILFGERGTSPTGETTYSWRGKVQFYVSRIAAAPNAPSSKEKP